MPRAMAVAKRRSSDCAYARSRATSAPPLLVHWYAWVPNSGGPTMFHAALHEWIGLVYYRLRRAWRWLLLTGFKTVASRPSARRREHRSAAYALRMLSSGRSANEAIGLRS